MYIRFTCAGLLLVAVQTAAAANVRPSGVVLDIRGHTLPQFQTSPLAVFPQLLTTLTDAVAAWKGFGQPTPLTVTVPSFFDTGLYQYQVGATQQSFMRWVRTLDRLYMHTRQAPARCAPS